MFPDVPDNHPEEPGDDRIEPTIKFEMDKLNAVIVSRLNRLPDSPEEMSFHPVPRHYKSLEATETLRIILKFGSSTPPIAIGLEVYGDVVLGRGAKDAANSNVDVDLANLDAFRRGVSRRHAMLRPTHSKLFLIDLDSTNGTFVNMVPVGRGVAREVRHGDIIALAGLNFVVEFVELPGDERGTITRRVDALTLKPEPDEIESDVGPDAADLPVTSETLPPGDVPHIRSPSVPPTRPIRQLRLRRMAAEDSAASSQPDRDGPEDDKPKDS